MRKFLLLLILIITFVEAKKVAICTTYAVGIDTEIECKGAVSGKTTIKKIYAKGYSLKESIAGGYKFILVFDK